MLLIGHSLDGMRQFQKARLYYQTAIESAHEANHNILQALAWYRHSRSWAYSDKRDHYKQALDCMFKASHFASLEADLEVQCVTQLGLAEAHAYLKEKDACLDALKNADKLDGYGAGDWSQQRGSNRMPDVFDLGIDAAGQTCPDAGGVWQTGI